MGFWQIYMGLYGGGGTVVTGPVTLLKPPLSMVRQAHERTLELEAHTRDIELQAHERTLILGE